MAAEWGPRVATALINLTMGVAITAIVDNVAAVARRPAPPASVPPASVPPATTRETRTRRYDEPLYYDR